MTHYTMGMLSGEDSKLAKKTKVATMAATDAAMRESTWIAPAM